jgi:hypothetical protein
MATEIINPYAPINPVDIINKNCQFTNEAYPNNGLNIKIKIQSDIIG